MQVGPSGASIWPAIGAPGERPRLGQPDQRARVERCGLTCRVVGRRRGVSRAGLPGLADAVRAVRLRLSGPGGGCRALRGFVDFARRGLPESGRLRRGLCAFCGVFVGAIWLSRWCSTSRIGGRCLLIRHSPRAPRRSGSRRDDRDQGQVRVRRCGDDISTSRTGREQDVDPVVGGLVGVGGEACWWRCRRRRRWRWCCWRPRAAAGCRRRWRGRWCVAE